jgi:transcriptional regulator GlxA family with amidase domain
MASQMSIVPFILQKMGIMNIAIVNFRDSVLSSVVGPYEMLGKTPSILENFGIESNSVKFEVEIVTDFNTFSQSGETTGHPQLSSAATLQSTKVYDLIVIPAMTEDKINIVLEREKRLIDWIKWQYHEGAEVASICLGAFILASTGLLHGKCATTHWLGVDYFKEMFPDVILVDDKIIVDNGNLYTSGGAFSFTSLMIYLIEKYCGHQAAVTMSKVFLVNVHDTQQTSYSILSLQRRHNDKQIKHVQQYIEENYMKSLKTETLAKIAILGVRTFIRRFKKATGNTPYEYIQRVKVEVAKKMLEKSNDGVEQISMNVGYIDFSAFRKVFKKNVGITPSDYKKRYSNMFFPGVSQVMLIEK